MQKEKKNFKNILLSEMEQGMHYVVKTGSKCGTFAKGDRVSKLENGDIGNSTASGWIPMDELGDLGTEVVVSLSERALAILNLKKEELEKQIAKFK